MKLGHADEALLRHQLDEAMLSARRLNEIIDELLVLSGVRRQPVAAQTRDPVVAELARLQSARDLELLNLFHLLAWALRPAPDSPSPTLASRFRAAWLGFWRG